MAKLLNSHCVKYALIALGHLEIYLEEYDGNQGSEALKDRGPQLCAELRALLEAAQ